MTEPTKDETPAAPLDPQTTEIDTSKLVSPRKESTPIGDEAQAAVAAQTSAEDDDEPDEDDDHEDLNASTEFPPLEKAKSYKVDVKRALERKTQDGKGDDEVPESDFVSFATDGVEKED